jgi:1-phosphofructokinase family hexose kinase
MPDEPPAIIAVSLNAAVDRALEVPGLVIGGHVRGRLISIQPAGKAVNVARFLGTLGVPCILTGFVGAGDRDRFKKSFKGTPVRVEVFEGRGPTRENITLIDPACGVETHIRDEGFSLADEDLERISKKLAILAVPGAYVVFAGSLPPDMTAEAFGGLLAACRERGARLAVDSSGPGLEPLRRGEPVWLVKPNRQELAELAGRPAETEDDIRAAAEVLRRRIEVVIVTLGEGGAYLFAAGGAWRAVPHSDPAAVIKTVGAGDALLAGFLHAHAAGADVSECLRRGVATGTAATHKLRAGVVEPEEIEACYRQVEVAPLG